MVSRFTASERRYIQGEIREKDWQATVVEYARMQGWQVHYTTQPQRSPSGWPDLVLIRPPELVIAELKTEFRHPTPEQQRTIDMLLACGIETHVWRPSQWPAVERRLR